MKTNKLLFSLLAVGMFAGVSLQASPVTLARFNLNDGNNDLNLDFIDGILMDNAGTSSVLTEDATGDATSWDNGRRISGIGNANYSDTANYFGFTAQAATGNVFDLSQAASFVELRVDRVFGDSYGIEAVIWEGTDRSGTELFRDEIALTTSDGNKQFGPVATIAGAATNISQIYVQFNYRSTNTALRMQDVELVGSTVVIPEPSTFALIGFVFVGLIYRLRRKK